MPATYLHLFFTGQLEQFYSDSINGTKEVNNPNDAFNIISKIFAGDIGDN